MGEMMNIYKKLLNIQTELKAPKGQYNSFGRYKYRSCEDILEAVKPLCNKYNAVLVLSDEIINVGEGGTDTRIEYFENKNESGHIKNENGRFYVKATATLYDTETKESCISNTAYARESFEKKRNG